MKKQKPQSTDSVSETQVSYQLSTGQTPDREIIISSLDEQEEANYMYWLSLTPLQRLELHYKMASAFWHDSLSVKKSKKIIKIK